MTDGAGRPGTPVLVYSDALTGYDFGKDHAMSPGRVEEAVGLARSLGVLDHLDVVAPPPADDALLATVHTPAYIEAVRRCQPDPEHGLGTTDNPVFPGMHEVSSQVVTATVEAARQVWEGGVLRASNIAGGLHHAMPDKTSGFCVYNDVAVGIRWLLDHGVERVAYVDVDVHHGDGVQTVFWDDPRVMTVSLHETPACLFPGTGFPTEIGGPGALGSAVNVALPPGTNDSGWLRAFHAIVPQVLAAHRPQVLVTQHGCDSHAHDPLADLDLTVDGQRASYLALADLADELCEGRWVSTGGGGYAVLHIVPRAWTHLLAIVGGEPLDPETPTPQSWRDKVGEYAPLTMGDGVEVSYRDFDGGFSPDSRLDQAIMATRRAVFPELGIDPGF
ncbi:acetoin utilization protein AcuC [Microlunatus flavus]|uniref:Acetoin utilization protein AcuC n=1 Tax=Microlunatus flavus TaxID=1036181 RepID=A0A1H8Z976_9ACTN|nr:acetoin utilization protein AcuC [Microlunatus flavus]SEP60168.1 acetoin utilization protein AcuC [Microlunatus flavus]